MTIRKGKDEAMLSQVESLMESYIAEISNSYIESLYKRLPQGKRLRAKLVLKIANESDKAAELAAIIEMIHAASLLHDDVIDDATTRRGVDSLNASEGSKQAVMMGDVLYSKGFEKLVEFDKEISAKISSAVTQLSVGEMMDVYLSKSFNDDPSLYLKMVYQKTAVLIEATAATAATLVGKDANIYGLYGKNLGIAFQIVDDILDITQSSEQLGKPSMHDFEEGKSTLPYIYLYESLGESDKRRLKALCAKSLDESEKRWIKEVMKSTGAIDKSYRYAKNLAEEAIFLMEKAGESSLADIATAMIEREF